LHALRSRILLYPGRCVIHCVAAVLAPVAGAERTTVLFCLRQSLGSKDKIRQYCIRESLIETRKGKRISYLLDLGAGSVRVATVTVDTYRQFIWYCIDLFRLVSGRRRPRVHALRGRNLLGPDRCVAAAVSWLQWRARELQGQPLCPRQSLVSNDIMRHYWILVREALIKTITLKGNGFFLI
jgi:hypothetical protein